MCLQRVTVLLARYFLLLVGQATYERVVLSVRGKSTQTAGHHTNSLNRFGDCLP